MAIFVDVFYPDNKNRKERIDQVTADCSGMFATAAAEKDKVETKLATCDQLLKDAYQSVAADPPEVKKVSLTNEWAIYVPNLLVDAVASTVALFAVRWGWANALVRAGKISAVELMVLGSKGAIEIIVPKWLRIFGEGAAVAAATVIIDMLIDSISGAVQRDELRKGIHEITETRVGMKQTEMHNQALNTLLDAVIVSFNAIKNLDLPAETINLLLSKLLEQNKMERNSISRATAVQELIKLDKFRNSWTKEDGDWTTAVPAANMLRTRSVSRAPGQVLFAPSPLESVTNAVRGLPLPSEKQRLILTRAQALAQEVI